jgi:hypothetical protein
MYRFGLSALRLINENTELEKAGRVGQDAFIRLRKTGDS